MTSNEIVTTQRTELMIREDQQGFDPKQRAALEQLGVERATDADLAVFFHQVVRTGLDPFARQIYMIERQGMQTIQTGIDGFRLIARRATDASRGTYGYRPTEWCGEDGIWHDVWLRREPPAAARVTVIRNGSEFPAVALYSEYVGRKRDGKVTQMWLTKGTLMLAKCAEALALRKAFPQDLTGIYTADEMGTGAVQDAPQADAAPARQRYAQAVGAEPPPEDAPADDSHPVETVEATEADFVPDLITAQQTKLLHTLVTKLGITDRDVKLANISDTIGRSIDTTAELTKVEAGIVIDALNEALGQS